MLSRLSERRALPHAWSILALILTVAVLYAAFAPNLAARSNSNDHGARIHTRDSKVHKKEPVECRDVHHVANQCAFVLEHCKDDNEAALIHYLSFYYCKMAGAQPVALLILVFWLVLLFSTIGIAASDFFSVNLDTLAKELGMSENLAGVTLLALGNGSPDVFSTFAAMKSNSGSMAVGELIGAACFITAVVAGSMALIRGEFKVNRSTFIRDVLFFIVAVSFTMVFLADGKLHIWECAAMILFYLFYVLFVFGSHLHATRRAKARAKIKASRTQIYSPGGVGTEEIEPYRDDPDEEMLLAGGRSRSAPEPADIGILERAAGAPRIEVTGSDLPSRQNVKDDEQRDMHAAAEMTSNMRVLRPRYGRSNTTITPIRPSLVGVLEFRSVLSSLQKERNMRMGALPERQHSSHGHNRSVSTGEDMRGRSRINTSPANLSASSRERALSHGNAPLNLESACLPQPDSGLGGAGTRTSSAARTVDGRLAPPSLLTQESQSSTQLPLRLNIPTSSGHSSPATSPFPRYSESPALLSPSSPHNPGYPFPDTLGDIRRRSIPGISESEEHPRPVSWWPYHVLPPPHVVATTLFPTLQGWKEKPIWDKALGLLSVPSIFLLVITLPVSETGEEGDEDDEEIDTAGLVDDNQFAPAILPGDGQEWQQFRRRTRSITSRSPRASPGLSPARTPLHVPRLPGDSVSLPHPFPFTHGHVPEADRITVSSEGPPLWNRWLYVVNLFMGPLFIVLILWLNMTEDPSEPPVDWAKTLTRLVLYSLLVSLCLVLGLFSTTTSSKKPKLHWIICIFGFIISVFWISTIAGEVVGVLKAVGVILNMSEAILGLTIFAMGNSVGDLFANITIARLGSPIMAL